MVLSCSSTLQFQAIRHLVLEAVSSTATLAGSRSSTVPFQAIALNMVEAFTIIMARSPSSIVPSRATHHLLRGAASPSLADELPLPFVLFMIIRLRMVAVSLFRIEEHNIVMWRWEIA